MKKEVMTQEEEDRNAYVIRKADGTVIPLEKSIKVGTKDAPKLVPDPKKAKVTKTVLFSWPVKKYCQHTFYVIQIQTKSLKNFVLGMNLKNF